MYMVIMYGTKAEVPVIMHRWSLLPMSTAQKSPVHMTHMQDGIYGATSQSPLVTSLPQVIVILEHRDAR
jgi:hypothetical protein